MKLSIQTIIFCLISSFIFAQNNTKKSVWLKFDTPQQKSATDLRQDKGALSLDVNDDLQLIDTQIDQIGMRHQRYQQTYRGVPIEGAVLVMHEKNDIVKSANGQLTQGLDMDVNPIISELFALQTAMASMEATLFAWDDPTHENMKKEVENNPAATFYPVSELVIVQPEYGGANTDFRLAYKFDIYAVEPHTRQHVYVDARMGDVIASIEQIHDCATGEGTIVAETNYSDMVDFTSCADGILKNSKGGGMQVFDDMNLGAHFQVPTYWSDPTATEVHWATEKVYDYLFATFGRNSLDGNGMRLYSWVHYDNDFNNAFWNGAWMTYGDGDGTTFNPLTSPDVVAHEMFHGVTDFTGGLVYEVESGALNESFSDIFGEVLERYMRGTNDWIIGADFTIQNGKNGLRNMSNPNDVSMLTRQPDTYDGTYWVTPSSACASFNDYCGVHVNSGVQNHWFYLLSEGGTGVNDNGESYEVSGIGMEKAAAIAYRNLTIYMTPNSTFADAREGSIQAAESLPQINSSEVNQVKAAWCAVGVGAECIVVDNCRTRDSLALVELYTTTGGTDWWSEHYPTTGSGQIIPWDLSSPMDLWGGVTLNSSGCVSQLELVDGRLIGSIPPELGDLSELEHLNLSVNYQLTGNLPGELGNLGNLNYLNVERCGLSGFFDPNLMSLCTQLTESDAWNINLDNHFTMFWDDFCNGTPYTPYTSCRAADSLLLVDLYNNLNGSSWQGNINSTPWDLTQPLETWDGIVLSNGCVAGIYLLYSTGDVEGTIPTSIGNFTELEYLSIRGSLSGNIPPDIGNLSQLEHLFISGSTTYVINNGTSTAEDGLEGAIPTEIGNLQNLKSLSLGANKLTGNIPLEIFGLSNLTSLYLSGNFLSGNLSSDIGNLSNLKAFNLWGNNFTGDVPVEISNLSNLETLVLSWNEFSGDIPIEIGNLSNLTNLNLDNNNFNGEIPTQLGNLSNLKYLNLSYNNLIGIIPAALGNLDNLLSMTLKYNDLSGCFDQNLMNLCGITNHFGAINEGNSFITDWDNFCEGATCSFNPFCRYTDSLILVDFYNSTNGSSWINNSWDLNQTIETWAGISTSNGCVIGIDLWDNGIVGSLPATLADLSHLEDLEIWSDQLTGSIPSELGNLSNLKTLSFYGPLSGNIPSELGNLINLEDLLITSTNITGNIPPELGNLSNLTRLSINASPITGSIPSELGNLTQLTNLSFQNTDISGSLPPELGNLINLEQIWINYGNLSGNIPPELGNLPYLEYLNLSGNNLTGSIPVELTNINLVVIHSNQLSGCYDPGLINLCNDLWNDPNGYISDGNNFDADWEDFCNFSSGACPLPDCRTIDSLALVDIHTSLNGPAWTPLTSETGMPWDLTRPITEWGGIGVDENGCVTSISLSNRGLSGNIPNSIGNISQLTNITLSNNVNITGIIPREIGNLEHLERLSLLHNSMTGAIPTEIGNCTKLKYLYLGDNQLTGEIPSSIGNCTELIWFSLYENAVTGTIPSSIGNLSNLELLTLRDNQLAGSIPEEIGYLPVLDFIVLSYNNLTGSVPASFGNFTNLDFLSLVHNNLSGCYDSNLSNLYYSNPSANIYIDNGNNFATPWEDFLATGIGTCNGTVLPGDFDNNGVVNINDFLYWGLNYLKTGPVRPDATTNFTPQEAPNWATSYNSINSKHTDADGNGTVEAADTNVLRLNYGLTYNTTPDTYEPSPIMFILVPSNIQSNTYELRLQGNTTISTHGITVTIETSQISIQSISFPQDNGTDIWDETFLKTEGSKLHIGMTKTNGIDITIDGTIASIVIFAEDIQTADPICIVEGGSMISSLGDLTPVMGSFQQNISTTLNAPASLIVNPAQCGMGGSAMIQTDSTMACTYAWSNNESGTNASNLPIGNNHVDITCPDGTTNTINFIIDWLYESVTVTADNTQICFNFPNAPLINPVQVSLGDGIERDPISDDICYNVPRGTYDNITIWDTNILCPLNVESLTVGPVCNSSARFTDAKTSAIASNFAQFAGDEFIKNFIQSEKAYIRYRNEIHQILNSKEARYEQVNADFDIIKEMALDALFQSFVRGNSLQINENHLQALDKFLLSLSAATRKSVLQNEITKARQHIHVMRDKELKEALIAYDRAGLHSSSINPIPTDKDNNILEVQLLNTLGRESRMTYQTTESGSIAIELYNINGQYIRPLQGASIQAGQHELIINKDDLTRGMYFIRIKFISETELTSDKVLKIPVMN